MPLPGGYLVDTNIVLALVRQNDLGRYLDATYGLLNPSFDVPACVVTFGEMAALANKFGWGLLKRAKLASLLDTLARVNISDPRVLSAYGDIDAWSEANGRIMGKNDIWIAAAALVTNTTALTTDTDFDHLHAPHAGRSWRVDREWVDPASKLPP